VTDIVPVFLIGGGGDHPEREETYGRFLEAATRGDRCRVALVSAAESPAEAEETFVATRAIFLALGAKETNFVGVFLSPGTPLTTSALANTDPTGVFICGGMTPLYQELLCQDRTWLSYLRVQGIPFGGVSAGAAIAATTAIVGGWRAQRGDRVRPILYEGAGEGLDLLDVRPGLGLVLFTVEVHASQWGTLTRLLQAIDLGLVTEGWAIDENTLLQSDAEGLRVFGAGQAYHVWLDECGELEVSIQPK